MILGALAMGMVGTSFVVGVQAVSSWTAKEIQGVALGIFGAGNVGTAVTTFGLPLLMGVAGWRGAFRWYALGMLTSGAIYWLVARNAPRTATIVRKSPLAPLQNAQTWRFGLYYMATFGVFVATTLTITDIYIDAFRMPLKTAGLLATTFTFTASLARIPGGKLADKFGARNVVCISQFVAAYVLIFVCFGPPLPATVLLVFAAALALGIGMGGVFRYIPDFFPATVGAVGGVVGALGGLGGFFLPQLSSALKLAFRNPFLQVLPLAVLPLIAVTVQHVAIKKRTAARAALDALSQPGH
jgi:NNP family nitrate/nitrite transporter-like MFS transporter